MPPGERRRGAWSPAGAPPRRRRLAAGLAALLAVGALASFGCEDRPVGSGTDAAAVGESPGSDAGPVAVHPVGRARAAAPEPQRRTTVARTYPLTAEAGDRFGITTTGLASEVRAGRANRGGNTRLVWVRPNDPVSVDQQVCATWTAVTGLAQPGLALRVRGDGPRVRAITITDNIFWGARFGFNVHAWDTASRRPGSLPVTALGGADLSATFGPANRLAALPWRVCARVQGQWLDFKAWPLATAEPRWGDTRYGRRFKLAPALVYEGRAGWYAGHLRPGDRISITDQATTDLTP